MSYQEKQMTFDHNQSAPEIKAGIPSGDAQDV